ncbi:hypothetical protein [Neobacillus niacini]|uniref:hypothetical protein n=1 Tax=Neobacillus niacini TaxID=86668 RepID=UPI002856B7F8|nr:hypothetical protein [Neobacillus niacini]MDR7000723.1 formate/nitrite transporter FocA (FNT family) [Neobacillus niacini]
MKLKSFIVAFSSLFFTTGLLYLVGNFFEIPWLMFQAEYTNTENGFSFSTGSLIPLMVGLIISFFAEKIFLYKHRQKLG